MFRELNDFITETLYEGLEESASPSALCISCVLFILTKENIVSNRQDVYHLIEFCNLECEKALQYDWRYLNNYYSTVSRYFRRYIDPNYNGINSDIFRPKNVNGGLLTLRFKKSLDTLTDTELSVYTKYYLNMMILIFVHCITSTGLRQELVNTYKEGLLKYVGSI